MHVWQYTFEFKKCALLPTKVNKKYFNRFQLIWLTSKASFRFRNFLVFNLLYLFTESLPSYCFSAKIKRRGQLTLCTKKIHTKFSNISAVFFQCLGTLNFKTETSNSNNSLILPIWHFQTHLDYPNN